MKAEGERVSSVSGTCLFCGVEGLLTEEQVKLEMIKKLVKPLISESSGKGCCISCSSFMDRLILLNADIAQTSANFRDTSAVINSLLGMKRNITLSGKIKVVVIVWSLGCKNYLRLLTLLIRKQL